MGTLLITWPDLSAVYGHVCPYMFQEPQPVSEIEIVTPLLEEEHEEVEVEQEVQQAQVVQ